LLWELRVERRDDRLASLTAWLSGDIDDTELPA